MLAALPRAVELHHQFHREAAPIVHRVDFERRVENHRLRSIRMLAHNLDVIAVLLAVGLKTEVENAFAD